jgi:hypothetical protein
LRRAGQLQLPTGGIVQSERDGVNYFYGGIHVETPSISYIHVINSNLDQPSEEPMPHPIYIRRAFSCHYPSTGFRLNKETLEMDWSQWAQWDFLMGPHSGDKFMGRKSRTDSDILSLESFFAVMIMSLHLSAPAAGDEIAAGD